MPVIDVLRAAIAEVEDYVRVDVASDSQDAVVGTAVNDVIHLVAELVENATTFSPPTTRVEIRADSVGNGFAVEIEDRGLGLPAGELAEINQRLASPPEFDLASSDQLGLFVVGQLLAGTHHGLAARLPLRGDYGHRADAAQPDRARRRGGPAARYHWSGQHGLGSQHGRASQRHQTTGPRQRQHLTGRPRSGGNTRAGGYLQPDRAAPARPEVTGDRS